ncbi:MAG: DUF3578 domain-containing protein [Deltaproteobacteria bacterium]|nr:DUF3578 domain-containing protein [Deltaproteobacteria bacterium]
MNIDMAIIKLSRAFWRVINIIEESQAKYPTPPLGQKIEINYEKDYLSLLTEEDRKMEIKAKVKNCKEEYVNQPGHPSKGHPVYFPLKIPRCEYRQSSGCSRPPNFLGRATILTNNEYEAKGYYKVIKGINASIEKIELMTCGLGRESLTEFEGELIIRGLKVKVKPERKEMYPQEKIDIKITLNEADPDGNEYPVKGEKLEISVKGIVNGRITKKEEYITDEKGEVILSYKAGDKDEKLVVKASFQPPEYPEKAKGSGDVIIKPIEYDATLTLKKKVVKEKRISFEDEHFDKPCNVHEKESLKFDETIQASVYVALRLKESADMPIFNQRWEYYTPVHVNLSNFTLYSVKEKSTYSNSTGKTCATGGHKTTEEIQKQLRTQKIEGAGTLASVPWIVVFNKKTSKAIKIIPAGYNIAYTFQQKEKTDISTWSSKGKKGDTYNNHKVKNSNFELGPVGDLIKDPSVSEQGNFIKEYLAIKKIPPDVLVKFGDGKNSFGGRGEKRINKKLKHGYNIEEHSYTWQMIRKKKK